MLGKKKKKEEKGSSTLVSCPHGQPCLLHSGLGGLKELKPPPANAEYVLSFRSDHVQTLQHSPTHKLFTLVFKAFYVPYFSFLVALWSKILL